MSELKPCPFCGGEAVIVRERHHPVPELCATEHSGEFRALPRPAVNAGWLMECDSCGAMGPHEYTTPVQTQEEAVAAWNRRVEVSGA